MLLVSTLKTCACIAQTLSKLPLWMHKALPKPSSIVLQNPSPKISQPTSVSPTYLGDVDKWLPVLLGWPQTTYKPQTTGLVRPFTTCFLSQHASFSPKTVLGCLSGSTFRETLLHLPEEDSKRSQNQETATCLPAACPGFLTRAERPASGLEGGLSHLYSHDRLTATGE